MGTAAAIGAAAGGPAGGGRAAAFELTLRRLAPSEADPQAWLPVFRRETWDPARTAVIVCDMWDLHHCHNAVAREKDMAPRANRFVQAARSAGALIIHAPSDCMEAYAQHPARLRVAGVPRAARIPEGIAGWCRQIPAEEAGRYPIDQSDGGEDDDPEVHRRWAADLTSLGRDAGRPWTKQTDLIDIENEDAISDDGEEVWSLLEERGIDRVMVLGVHANMCVLGRPFGLRQMARHGKQVVLVRDLTDTMYNPARWPYVNHHTGTDLIVEHIEKYVCPTIESSDLLGGAPHRYFDDRRPRVVVLTAEYEYSTARTLPAFAARQLRPDLQVEFLLHDDPQRHELEGLRLLERADVLVLSVWRRTLPAAQLACIRNFLAAGKAVVGMRTSSHAFTPREGQASHGGAVWTDFDREIFGARYKGHYGNRRERGEPATQVFVAGEDVAENPLLRGLARPQFETASWLYKIEDAAAGNQVLLQGRVGADGRVEPVAWTAVTPAGGRSFYVSLGHPEDFELPEFQVLLRNAIYWAAGEPPPGYLLPPQAPPTSDGRDG
jgi:nicotinamidase-related amidase/type 1 glutamine amidotransferase